jgi:glyoxylase-like metal-dependent hydrolase (beta-lactamase superfamily II)
VVGDPEGVEIDGRRVLTGMKLTNRFEFFLIASLAAFFFAGLAVGAAHPASTSSASAVPHDRALIVAAAEALGGLEKVQHIKNITLIGYGMYAYQFGGGNVTASPLAVQRYLAANDLRRVYDLEHGRFQHIERRNMLFTFARATPTLWEPFNLVLDGDVAYDVASDGTPARVPRWIANAWYVDGVHMRRMWMLNNPVAVIRAALDPSTMVGPAHTERDARNDGDVDVVDLTLKEGDKLTLAMSTSTHLPAWVRWNNPHDTFGEYTFTTYLEGYVPYAGLLLPLSYNTKTDWRNISELQISVDGYDIDGKIANLAAPPEVRDTPDPQLKLSPVTATPIAKGIWYLSGGPLNSNGTVSAQGTTVFEFSDHLVLFELNSKVMAKSIIEFAKTLVPGKVPTAVITSHAHTDHIDGIRVAVAEGLSVISRRENELIIRDMIAHQAPDYPDALSEHPQPLKFVPVDEHLRLQDPTMIVDVYWARTNSHMADGLFAYAPGAKVMAEADIATAARDYQPWADNYMDDLEHYKIDVETLLPVHFPPMKQADVIEFIKGGVERFRARCAAEIARGVAYQGCPVLTKRY